MKVIFHPEASEETIESARFYEAKSEGLGADFLTAVADATPASSNSLKQAQSTARTSASDWYPVFLSRFFTKYSLIVSSSLP